MLPTTTADLATGAGSADDLGAHWDGDGVNFAVFSAHAERIEVCLYSADGTREIARIPLRERSGDIWHVHVRAIGPGTQYGFRAHGPYVPEQGHRFNPNKLLLDPYARRIAGAFRWNGPVYGYDSSSEDGDLSFDPRDSAASVPRSVVTRPDEPCDARRPRTPWERTIIYEAHPRGLTMQHPEIPEADRGRLAALASDPILDHLSNLGVTTIELMPAQACLDEPFLSKRGLRNYWGYNPFAFFIPEQRYLGPGGMADVREMVHGFHGAGIEVILDVVYNHTAEGNELGPTLSFRGLDNASYYLLHGDRPRYYANDTGCGNTLNVSHPFVLRLVLDSLRYWAGMTGVDGFRFDLATTLGRERDGFDLDGGFFDALRQDPVLSRLKLIAEPWDTGPDGYRLGGFPPTFAEWNDRFRDATRRFWRGDSATASELASLILGSADRFDRAGRRPWASINYVTAHDGFTLEDLVSYAETHNVANGEGNRDGHGENFSANCGCEGPTADAGILARRARRKRNLLATVLLSQGTPMLLAGDELGNSQGGNNNAYCQDNATGWTDWSGAGDSLHWFVQRLIGIRSEHPALRQPRFLHGNQAPCNGGPDITWWRRRRRTGGLVRARIASLRNPAPGCRRYPGIRSVGRRGSPGLQRRECERISPPRNPAPPWLDSDPRHRLSRRRTRIQRYRFRDHMDRRGLDRDVRPRPLTGLIPPAWWLSPSHAAASPERVNMDRICGIVGGQPLQDLATGGPALPRWREQVSAIRTHRYERDTTQSGTGRMRLKNRTALITAAGAGIGLATARLFAREGASVTATDINADSLPSLANEGIATRKLDVTDSEAVRAVSRDLGAVDVLFNCAGFVGHGTILDCEPDDFNSSMDLNVGGAYRMTRAFLPAMIRAGGGCIINMASVLSSIIAAPNRFAYGVGKAAVIGFTKSIAADFTSQGIRCNAICPGAVDTPSLEERMRALGGDYEEARTHYISRQPVGRLGQPEEIAALALYLASDESTFVTGQAITIDGGWSNV